MEFAKISWDSPFFFIAAVEGKQHIGWDGQFVLSSNAVPEFIGFVITVMKF